MPAGTARNSSGRGSAETILQLLQSATGDGARQPASRSRAYGKLHYACDAPRSDRIAVADAVDAIYAGLSLPPPRIVWCDGPLALARTWAASDAVDAATFRIAFLSSIRRLAGLPKRACANGGAQHIEDEIHARRVPVIEKRLQDLVLDRVGRKRPSLLRNARSLTAARRAFAELGRRPVFARCGLSQYRLERALGALPDAALALPPDASVRVVSRLARNVAWIVPARKLCLVCELPVSLTSDEAGQLHSYGAPAVQFRDGFAVHAWKGTVVPGWMIETPHAVTMSWIDAQIDPDVRRATIDIFGIDRFIAEGGAAKAICDPVGTLWRRDWTHRGVVIDTWSALECASDALPGNYPRRPRYTWVPSSLDTPQAAVHWLVGTSPLATTTTPAVEA